MSRHLAPYCKEILGADISDGMVEAYNKNAQASEVTKNKIKAIRLELKGDDEELDGKRFDFITVSHGCFTSLRFGADGPPM